MRLRLFLFLSCVSLFAWSGMGCTTNYHSYSIGGTVTGLAGTLVLQNSSAYLVQITKNGAYTFPVKVMDRGSYTVTVHTEPEGQLCSVANGTGTIDGADVTNINVTCLGGSFFSVGGTVTGLSDGAVVLQNNGEETVTVTSDGDYAFATAIAAGEAYDVVLLAQPTDQTCTLSNPSGIIGAVNVTNVNVECVMN